MKVKILSFLVVALLVFTSCSSQKTVSNDDEFAVDAGGGTDNSASDQDLSLDGADMSPATDNTAKAQPAPAPTDANSDMALENELNNLDSSSATQNAPPAVAPPSSSSDELSLDEPAAADTPPQDLAMNTPAPAPEQPAMQAQPPPPPPPPAAQDMSAQVPDLPPEPPPAEVQTPPPPPDIIETPVAPAPDMMAQDNAKPATIESLEYRANDGGGTIAIGANQPLKYTTRMNSATNQLIVEVDNSVLPQRLKRSLNTKDMASSIGSVDLYQKSGSNISRFVVQLRPGSPEPIVQQEGNSLLIIGGANAVAPSSNSDVADSGGQSGADFKDMNNANIMSADNLEEYLANNRKFYGKKISIETNNMDIKDVIKFLSEESGVNIVMDDGITGSVSLKLRDVPWDQAFVLVLRQKKLGYIRQGNVLRIATIDTIKNEEQEALDMQAKRKKQEDLVVRRFYIGYASITDLQTKITQFLSNTAVPTTPGTAPATVDPNAVAKVIADTRTSSLIVTDTSDNMAKIEKLIQALDTKPEQVLIEGKIVEAKESFTKAMGVRWTTTNSPTSGTRYSFGITPSVGTGLNILDTSVTFGALDSIGDLSARLQLGEQEDKVKVLSSPRITVLSNQQATIKQDTTISVPKSTTNTTSGSATTTTIFDQVPVGISLIVTPQVAYDGNVTLDLNLHKSQIASAGGISIDSRDAITKVTVRSGQAAVIGGIFESQVATSVAGLPVLKDIPIVGTLFGGQNDQTTKNELIIFVTPHVVKDSAQGMADTSQSPLNDIQ